MIIVNLKGGLGNQMFQYACGKALLLRNRSKGLEQELKLDMSGYARIKSSDTLRTYSLGAFRIDTPLAPLEEIARIKYPFGILSKGWRFFRAKALRRYDTGYDPRVLERRGDIYLDGYWQSEKYFTDIAGIIRNDFSLKDGFGPAAEAAARTIAGERNPVSLHVRRGDYVSNAKTNASYGTCSPDYYRQAVTMILEKNPGARFFVFSDDIPWAKENLGLSAETFYVSGNGIKDCEEVILMSKCKHHIIANSSFSWWGARLDPNPDKTVVAPERWFNRSPRSYYKDIVPDSWTRI